MRKNSRDVFWYVMYVAKYYSWKNLDIKVHKWF